MPTEKLMKGEFDWFPAFHLQFHALLLPHVMALPNDVTAPASVTRRLGGKRYSNAGAFSGRCPDSSW
jgi:hypothetical protein